VKIYRKVLIGSIVVYILGLSFVTLSAMLVPNTVFKWKETLQISTPGILLIGILYIRHRLAWKAYKVLIIGVGLVTLVLTLFQVFPTSVFILTIVALCGIYISSSPELRKIKKIEIKIIK
jgi:hypothetical protein